MGDRGSIGIVLMSGATIGALILVVGIVDEPAAFYRLTSSASAKVIQILILLTVTFGFGLNVYWLTRNVSRSEIMLRLSNLCVGLVPICVVSSSILVGLDSVKLRYGQFDFEVTRTEPVVAIIASLIILISTIFWATNSAGRFAREDADLVPT
jgi:hypothetical protein